MKCRHVIHLHLQQHCVVDEVSFWFYGATVFGSHATFVTPDLWLHTAPFVNSRRAMAVNWKKEISEQYVHLQGPQ